MRARTLLAAGPMLAAVLVTGCSTTDAGTPISGSTGASTAPGGSTPRSEVDLASTDPCTMLTETEAQQVGVPSPGVRDDVAGFLSCDWQLSARDDPEFDTGMLVSVSIDPERGIEELNLSGAVRITPTTVGSHQGQLVAESGGFGGPGTCQVDLVISPSSHVTVSALTGIDTERACDVATRAAASVEPKLP